MFKVRYSWFGVVVIAWMTTDALVEMTEYPSFNFEVLAYAP